MMTPQDKLTLAIIAMVGEDEYKRMVAAAAAKKGQK